MKVQIITTETDAIVAILLCDMYGVLDSQMFTEPAPAAPVFDKHIKIRFAVGRAFVEAEYDGTTTPVEKSDNIELDTLDNIPYVEYCIQGATYRRLPMVNEEQEIRTMKRGTFPVFLLHIPRETFDVTGNAKIALCTVFTNDKFDSSEQDVWQKYCETNIKIENV